MIGPKLTDAEHAVAVREAAKALEECVRNAAADGLAVKLEIVAASGSQRGRDVMTRFDAVRPTIVRPL